MLSSGFLIGRVVKPLFLFFVTFFAVRYITGSATDGAIVGLIPGVLGLTNIYVRLGYAVVAMSLVALALFVLTPASTREAFVAKAGAFMEKIAHPSDANSPSTRKHTRS